MDINLYEELKRLHEENLSRPSLWQQRIIFLNEKKVKKITLAKRKVTKEVQILRYLNNAGADFVPKILESNEEEYFVMERVEGVSLKVILDNLHLIPIPDFIPIIPEVKKSIKKLHLLGVLHGDPCGSNLIMRLGLEGQWHCTVIDFEEASRCDEQERYEYEMYLPGENLRYYSSSKDKNKKEHFLEILEEVFK